MPSDEFLAQDQARIERQITHASALGNTKLLEKLERIQVIRQEIAARREATYGNPTTERNSTD